MAYQVHHVNKKTGVTYVYESISFWDKEKRQPRNKQVCVGKLDSITGAFVPSKRLNSAQAASRDPGVTATAEIVGPSIILDTLTQRLGLEALLKSCFPDTYQQIQMMAYYLTLQGGPLCYCETWCRRYSSKLAGTLASQRISEILGSIGTDEKQTFLSKWMQSIAEDDYLCYDITSVSSYSELNEYIKQGYNRDQEKLPQMNLAMVYGQKEQLPVYYHRLPGSITDVATVHNLLKTFKALKMRTLHHVMDKGFYSRKNIDDLLASKQKFIVSVPLNNKWVQKAIDEVCDVIHGPEGYRKIDDEIVYVHTRLYPWGEHKKRCYLHLYYNDHRRADAVNRFNSKLLEYKKELESGELVADHKEAYESFFIVKTTPKRGRSVSYNSDAVKQHIKKYVGFQAYLANGIKDPVEALQVYRNKDAVEKAFDDLKNSLDMKRLRMHSSATVDGRIFVQFIALIYISALRKELRASGLIEKYTVRDVLEEMKTLTKIQYTGRYGHILTELTKSQRDILIALKIDLPV